MFIRSLFSFLRLFVFQWNNFNVQNVQFFCNFLKPHLMVTTVKSEFFLFCHYYYYYYYLNVFSWGVKWNLSAMQQKNHVKNVFRYYLIAIALTVFDRHMFTRCEFQFFFLFFFFQSLFFFQFKVREWETTTLDDLIYYLNVVKLSLIIMYT